MDFSSMMDAARREFMERQKQKNLEAGGSRPMPYPGTRAPNPNTNLTMNPDRSVQQQMAEKQIAERQKKKQMLEAYMKGGHQVPSNIPPVRPNTPAEVPAAPPTPAPAPMAVKGPVPTPNFRERNLPGVNDVKPNPWKNMLREGINQMATPGYFDKARGVWVSGAHAYGEKKAGKVKENKTIELLKRKGYSQEDAEAIVANPNVAKGVLAQVSKPKGFDGKETTFDREVAKDAAEWGAKRQDVVNDIRALDEATKYLEDQVSNPDWLNQNSTVSNFYRSFAPDKLQTLSEAGRELKSNRDLVYSITAKNLKLILGGQFAQKEGEQLLARTYDKDLLPEENLQRVRRLQESMKRAYVAKERLYARDDLTPEQKARSMEAIRQQVLDENTDTKSKETSGGFTYLGAE